MQTSFFLSAWYFRENKPKKTTTKPDATERQQCQKVVISSCSIFISHISYTICGVAALKLNHFVRSFCGIFRWVVQYFSHLHHPHCAHRHRAHWKCIHTAQHSRAEHTAVQVSMVHYAKQSCCCRNWCLYRSQFSEHMDWMCGERFVLNSDLAFSVD